MPTDSSSAPKRSISPALILLLGLVVIVVASLLGVYTGLQQLDPEVFDRSGPLPSGTVLTIPDEPQIIGGLSTRILRDYRFLIRDPEAQQRFIANGEVQYLPAGSQWVIKEYDLNMFFLQSTEDPSRQFWVNEEFFVPNPKQ
ncbi:MAG: hypothetical protein ACFCU3_00120 [Verrucomicrobiales bacterium]